MMSSASDAGVTHSGRVRTTSDGERPQWTPKGSDKSSMESLIRNKSEAAAKLSPCSPRVTDASRVAFLVALPAAARALVSTVDTT